MNPVRRAILETLADGRRHSGARIAEELGITRAAISRHVRLLRDAGWPIKGRAGQGYCLEGARRPIRLERIQHCLSAPELPVSAIEVLSEVESTNDYLAARDFPPDGGVAVCVAEQQTAGRGRHGRRWLAPPGGGITFSLARVFARPPAELAGLALAVGVSVTRTLRREGVPAMLKWPNDILVDDCKLAGILIDLAGESTGPSRVVIGVGVNHDLAGLPASINQAVSDLVSHGLARPRDEMIGLLVADLVQAIALFEHHGLAGFATEWTEMDALAGRDVSVFSGDVVHRGRALGIDADGAFRVELADGPRRFVSAEVSVRTGAQQ